MTNVLTFVPKNKQPDLTIEGEGDTYIVKLPMAVNIFVYAVRKRDKKLADYFRAKIREAINENALEIEVSSEMCIINDDPTRLEVLRSSLLL